MAAYVFREELEQASLEWQLRRLMGIRLVANVEALALESGLPENEVRSLLEAMITRREVVRLRPWGYTKDDMDFFRLCRLPRAASGAAWRRGRRHSWHRWIESARRAVRTPILGRKQNAYA
ncbi:MAG: hypothetical protein WC381_08725 [Kiritimatiellia bacterium]|jgi:hypothetical protein